MKYSDFAEACEHISSTSKRLEIRTQVAALLAGLSSEEVAPALYMLQGLLRPEYEGIELGMGEALAIKAISLVTAVDESKVKELTASSGDLGVTAFELLSQRTSERIGQPLTIVEVYDSLLAVGGMAGGGSQDAKTMAVAALLGRAAPMEGKHLVRFLLGKLRLGVKEMTILDALAEVYGKDDVKAARVKIEWVFNVAPDLGDIGNLLAKGGLSSLNHVTVSLGKPVRSMLAEREATLSDVLVRMEGKAALEYKYDGLRMQAHIPAEGRIHLFSRRLEDVSQQFPEIVGALANAFKARPVIVDGECVPFDPVTGELRSFQEISRRRGRKYDLVRMAQEVPVKLCLFDVLLVGDRPCLGLPYVERRKLLEETLTVGERVELATQSIVNSPQEAEIFFEKALSDGCEGVVAKSLSSQSIYQAGARGFWWIKYKREYTQELADTIDAVIVGAFRGRGKRTGWYGAFLMAVYDKDKDTYPSLCKVGTGFDEAALADLTKRLKVITPEERRVTVETTLSPDVWVEPTVVLELRGAELSLSPVHSAARDKVKQGFGLALRFPRYTGRLRDDKSSDDCTTVEEVMRLFQTQVRKVRGPDEKP
jgi:DNA ligase-1